MATERRDVIVLAAQATTAVFAVVQLAGVLVKPARAVAFGVDALLFAAGSAIFFWAYAVAVGRSRTDEIGIGGLFFLAGPDTAPRPVKVALLTTLAVHVAVAVAAAAARPFTSLAFGVLTPLSTLALVGLWGAKHGRFGARGDRPSR